MTRSTGHSGKPFRKLGSVILWAVCTAVAAVVLLAILGFLRNRSLTTMRLALVGLVAVALWQFLLVLHRRAQGRRGHVLLMRVLLSLVCVLALVIAWSTSTASMSSTRSTMFFNNSERHVYVKISLIGQSGVLTDEVYSLKLAPGAKARFRYPDGGRKNTYALAMSTYSAERGAISRVPIIGATVEEWTGLSTVLGEVVHREVFAGDATPARLTVKRQGSKLTAISDEEEDLYLVPVPEGRQPGS